MTLDTLAVDCQSLVAGYRLRLKAGQATVRERYLAEGNAPNLLRERCLLIDAVLSDLWQELDLPATLALVAVGGYGRGELYPASDVDLLVLLPAPPDSALTTQLERVVTVFYDLGLEIAPSVRTVDECSQAAAGDLTIQTALLEARWLAGSEELFKELSAALEEVLDPHIYFEAKKSEQDERYLRHQGSPYPLEPNCKEAPGGLRDLQTIVWIARAAGYGKTWEDLARQGFLTQEEQAQLQRSVRFLQELRTRLHLHVGRREDRLLFDYQSALAEQWGYRATPTRRASELLMQHYYRAAKEVTQINTILLLNLGAAIAPLPDQPPQPLNEHFQNTQDLLDVVDEEAFSKEPGVILEAFLLMQQHPELQGMSARTLRAMWHARTLIDKDFRRDSANRLRFLAILQQPRGVLHECRRMNQFGILGRYLPNFGKIVGQMQHDLFHVYTVDQHMLQVLRNLRRFLADEFTHEYPLCSELISDFPRCWVLYVAALFHDIAKGRGGDHSELGAVDAAAFCVDHGIDEDDSELIVWLVRQHLLMSSVAQKQDIADPDVIGAFAAQVRDERHLRALYLFTVADIRGTSPKVWNSWKGQLLVQLFRTTCRTLLAGGQVPVRQGLIEERQQEALRLLRYFALPDAVHHRLWKQLDTVYFLRHSAEEVAWHTRSLHYRTGIEEPVVRARVNPQGDGLEVMIYTRDQRDLFARLVGFFARAGYTIVDAKVHTTRHGYALDSFMLLDISDRGSERAMISYVEHELTARLRQQNPPEAPGSGRISRQVKHFPIQPVVTIEPDEKGSHYVLSVNAADRPGLLYTIAMTLAAHGANLHTAKISTLGERVEDTFLISGGDLGEAASRIRLETELLERLKL
ncbi:Bifunctional uridylyltransferase/uridylyl-removing enzyme (Includes: (Protein-PII) uridylyltransferase; (Protein-PII)-UMP uridylyl-removing enzyme) [Candidatus Accumulibacter aalborgensis]|uniref:Bifunctional uridylyltransferase/uridylyl-removing enzyme n=1 Tax=Candidatus Accumulibacter aalborgensis TaxID=1860102 RepID=A0A1A8XLE6_9PROT|nr:[protein-PII] uridylyltransferase [Candidatus Accumulibacter aalborgensis]SBT05237.1 Bifunctional uridylyltransferase/uridylyl-removing enzyme (Includes: (Protein-PII) uridylyltransferase; (Protein-PII)-UMP uridylyl-removing enzyme) [Candidatus Accumulibacter aalborgensis]